MEMKRRSFVAALACLVVGPHEPIPFDWTVRRVYSIPKTMKAWLPPHVGVNWADPTYFQIEKHFRTLRLTLRDFRELDRTIIVPRPL
jgi:hypothetical protein